MNAKIISRGTGREYPVDFSARIKKKLVSHPLLKLRSEKELALTIGPTDGVALPEDEYELHAASGVIILVRNIGPGRWFLESYVVA